MIESFETLKLVIFALSMVVLALSFILFYGFGET